jgi:hypothetical protein
MRRITMYQLRRCRSTLVGLIGIALFSATAVAETKYVTWDYTGINTQIMGVDGNEFVGSSFDGGFFYDGANTRSIAVPSAQATYPMDVCGNDIVGIYQDYSNAYHGFLFDGSTYRNVDYPSASFGSYQGCRLMGISGSNVAGLYDDSTGSSHGFVYNVTTSTFSTYNHPSAISGGVGSGTRVRGISGSKIVGDYTTSTGRVGFVFDGSTYTDVNNPSGSNYVEIWDLEGDKILGSDVGFGFLCTGSSVEYLNYPGATATKAFGISGNTVVGQYWDASSRTHGFIATIPEPSSFALLIVSLAGLGGCLWLRRNVF